MHRPRPWLILLVAAVALHVALCAAAWRIPPSIQSDSAMGFLVWDAMKHGGPWNCLVAPDAANIARDSAQFLAWWSPGQYLVAGPWEAFGLPLGQAIPLGCLTAALIGFAGYWRLFRSWGFAPGICAWSIFAIATNWTLTHPYGEFLGGEAALLAILPWLILALRRAEHRGMGSWVGVPATLWLGAMAKLAFVPVGAGLVAGLRLPAIRAQRNRPLAVAAECLRCAVWLALGYLLVWATFLRWGPNPGSPGGDRPHIPWWNALLQLAGRPVSSAFCWGNLVDRIFLYPAAPRVSTPLALWPINGLIALAGVIIVIAILRREFRERSGYAWLLVGVLAAMEAFYALALCLHLDTDFDDRLFKPAGILLIPGLAAWIAAHLRSWRGWALGAAGAVTMLYGVAAGIDHCAINARIGNVGPQGITQHVLSPAALRALRLADQAAPPGTVIYVPSPEIALAVSRLRPIASHAVQTSAATLARVQYHGRASRVILLLNEPLFAQGRAQAVMNSFVDYDPRAWHDSVVGDWHFLTQ